MTYVDIQSLPIGAIVVNDEALVADANEAMLRLLDRDPVGSRVDDLVEPAAAADICCLIAGTSPTNRIEARLSADGPVTFLEVTVASHPTDGATVVYFQPIPHRDALTGLPDRLALVHHIDLVLRGMRRRRRSALVMLIGLDGFTEINENLGEAMGDAVLVEAACRLQASLRPDDTVARLGGDEFVVLCPDVDPEFAPPLIARLERAANARIDIDGQRLSLQASLGAVVFDDPDETVTSLLSRSYQEMLAQKPSLFIG